MLWLKTYNYSIDNVRLKAQSQPFFNCAFFCYNQIINHHADLCLSGKKIHEIVVWNKEKIANNFLVQGTKIQALLLLRN